MVKTFARNWPLKEQDFEEIIDDALMKAYDNIHKIDTLQGLVAFFRKTTISGAFDRLRRELALKRGEGKVLITADLNEIEQDDKDEGSKETGALEIDPHVFWTALNEQLPNTDPLPVRELHTANCRQLLCDLLDELEPSDRELIESYYFGQLKHREIAEKLNELNQSNKSEKQIGSEIDRAREKLARKIPMNLREELEALYGR